MQQCPMHIRLLNLSGLGGLNSEKVVGEQPWKLRDPRALPAGDASLRVGQRTSVDGGQVGRS